MAPVVHRQPIRDELFRENAASEFEHPRCRVNDTVAFLAPSRTRQIERGRLRGGFQDGLPSGSITVQSESSLAGKIPVVPHQTIHRVLVFCFDTGHLYGKRPIPADKGHH